MLEEISLSPLYSFIQWDHQPQFFPAALYHVAFQYFLQEEPSVFAHAIDVKNDLSTHFDQGCMGGSHVNQGLNKFI